MTQTDSVAIDMPQYLTCVLEADLRLRLRFFWKVIGPSTGSSNTDYCIRCKPMMKIVSHFVCEGFVFVGPVPSLEGLKP